ncbi:peptidase P60 [Pandoraea terrae]|uniref:Peptidase P60 n=1 Tax=Pandoraea terrae TaxID=1537710 RepID=A0A5E4WXW1_9BURK|nr:C40 family peptidase [Pandoraea terrae]VVE27816.1 peptidase P60 [Pandoraea terrae]
MHSSDLVRLPARLLPMLAVTALVAACSSTPTRYAGNGDLRARPYGAEKSAGQEEITLAAMGLVGVPYRYGGNTPDSGFDCSGLVRYVVLRAAGVNLPRTTEQMSTVGTSIDLDQLASGDLVYFNTTGRSHSHVGIYVGNGQFVHAPATGGTVRLANMSLPYWAGRFDGVRRVAANLAPGSDTTYVNRAPAPLPPPGARPTPANAAGNATAPLDDDPIARFADGTF